MKCTLFLAAVAYAKHQEFHEWASKWGHNPTPALKATYEANLRQIEQQSKFHPGVTFSVNQFSGMTPDEFAAAYTMTPSNDEAMDFFECHC
jgi:hypothetical protein